MIKGQATRLTPFFIMMMMMMMMMMNSNILFILA